MTVNGTFERVCVLGLGYIGLPTSAALAARGFTIHGVEVNPESGKVPASDRERS